MLFIYGTLRKGAQSRHIIEKHIVSSAPATVTGSLFYLKNRYPLLSTSGDTQIVGELVECVDETKALKELDSFEGPEYVREKIGVAKENGERAEAWAYVCPDEHVLAGCEKIESGDWLEYAKSAEGFTDSSISSGILRQFR